MAQNTNSEKPSPDFGNIAGNPADQADLLALIKAGGTVGTLYSLASLTGVSGKIPYFTGADTMSQTNTPVIAGATITNTALYNKTLMSGSAGAITSGSTQGTSGSFAGSGSAGGWGFADESAFNAFKALVNGMWTGLKSHGIVS
jgi:hypothetical protein